MCGIVGYIGEKNCVPILINGLKRLEYRGYDSAGLGVLTNNHSVVIKNKGKVSLLEEKVQKTNLSGKVGIGHTRWATHGVPNEINAHPHYNTSRNLYVIHNGIIENFRTLKKGLEKLGYVFETETDSEVLPHLIDSFLKKGNPLFKAVRLALTEVEGTYGIAVVYEGEPDKIIAARKGSPLVLGLGDNENFIASDVSAILAHTKQVIYIEDGELVEVYKDKFIVKTITDNEIEKEIHEISMTLDEIDKGGFSHFMLKEIMEQPETISNSIRGRILFEKGTSRLGGLTEVVDRLVNSKRIIITACGTSWHAGLVGEYMFEQFCRIPTEVEYASEFRYRNPIINHDDTINSILRLNDQIEKIASEFHDANNFLYLGRGYNFPVALEGALKLKEISYIHAEGYPAAEMKHGPIALIDQEMPVVVLAPAGRILEKILNNIEEVR